MKSVLLVLLNLQTYARLFFGNATDALADFGFAPKKAPAKRTGTGTVKAAEKSVATRAARHTMGKKQKKLVKGTVEVPVTSLPASPAAAPAAAAPAAAGSNGSAPRA